MRSMGSLGVKILRNGEGSDTKAAASLSGGQGAKGKMAGPQLVHPVPGCFGAEAGPRAVERNLGFTELLSRKGLRSNLPLQRGTWRARSWEGTECVLV